MSDLFGRLLGAAARKAAASRAAGPPARADAHPPVSPAPGPPIAQGQPAGHRQPARRWYPTIQNPDARGLALFEERPDGVYATIDNRDYPTDRAQPMFRIESGKVFPTVTNTRFRHGLACFEIRGNQVFPTPDNPVDPWGVPLYDIS